MILGPCLLSCTSKIAGLVEWSEIWEELRVVSGSKAIFCPNYGSRFAHFAQDFLPDIHLTSKRFLNFSFANSIVPDPLLNTFLPRDEDIDELYVLVHEYLAKGKQSRQ